MAKKKKQGFKYLYRTYLAKYRQDKGLSQVKLAKAIGMFPANTILLKMVKKAGS